MSFLYSVRDLLPLKIIIKEVIENLVIYSEKLNFLSISTVYENNNKTIVVETSPRMTPKSNNISIKYHWFSQHVGKYFCDSEDRVRKPEGRYFHQNFTRWIICMG